MASLTELKSPPPSPKSGGWQNDPIQSYAWRHDLEDQRIELGVTPAHSVDFSPGFPDRIRGFRGSGVPGWATESVYLEGFDDPSPSVSATDSDAGTRVSRWSTRARFERPIPEATRVSLHEMQRVMGKRVVNFDQREMLGFHRKHWETMLYKKHHIDASAGTKQYLGNWIKTVLNKKKRFFRCSVQNKASVFQIEALISQIEGKCPPFEFLTIQIKRKHYETLSHIKSFDSLRGFIITSLYTQRMIHLNIIW